MGGCQPFIGLLFTVGILVSFFHLNSYLNTDPARCHELSAVGYVVFLIVSIACSLFPLASHRIASRRMAFALIGSSSSAQTLSQIAQLTAVAGMGLCYGLCNACFGWRGAKCVTA